MASPRMAMAQRRAGMEMADLEYAYALQMEEAIAASMREAANRGELEEIGAEEEATIHDKREGDASGAVEREEEEEDEEDGSVLDCEKEYDIEVQAVKTPEGHVGIGVMLTDPGTETEARVLWQQSRYAGQGLSWHVAEYGGLLEAMEVAERLGVQLLCVRVSSRVVSDQVRWLIQFRGDCFIITFLGFLLQEIVNVVLLFVIRVRGKLRGYIFSLLFDFWRFVGFCARRRSLMRRG